MGFIFGFFRQKTPHFYLAQIIKKIAFYAGEKFKKTYRFPPVFF